MRHTKILLASLVLLSAGALFSGCASHTANGKTHTRLVGGLYESEEGAYDQQTATGIPINSKEPAPGARLSGDKVSLFWGLISFRDQ